MSAIQKKKNFISIEKKFVECMIEYKNIIGNKKQFADCSFTKQKAD